MMHNVYIIRAPGQLSSVRHPRYLGGVETEIEIAECTVVVVPDQENGLQPSLDCLGQNL